MGSFYDLDYIIEINERRLEQYSGAYQKNVDRFTNILVIYSAFAIFLIPIVQALFFTESTCYWLHHASFYLFIVLLAASVVNTVRLLIPVESAYLEEPSKYYKEYRLEYERKEWGKTMIDSLMKASYISELEQAVGLNKEIFRRKSRFYHRAFTFAVAACVPYLLCIGFQIAIKDDKIQKVEIMNNVSNFSEIKEHMAKDPNKSRQHTVTVETGSLPGVDSSKVIPSAPMLIKEGFQTGLGKANKAPKR